MKGKLFGARWRTWKAPEGCFNFILLRGLTHLEWPQILIVNTETQTFSHGFYAPGFMLQDCQELNFMWLLYSTSFSPACQQENFHGPVFSSAQLTIILASPILLILGSWRLDHVPNILFLDLVGPTIFYSSSS